MGLAIYQCWFHLSLAPEHARDAFQQGFEKFMTLHIVECTAPRSKNDKFDLYSNLNHNWNKDREYS